MRVFHRPFGGRRVGREFWENMHGDGRTRGAPGDDGPGDGVDPFTPRKQFQRKTANWIPRQTSAHGRLEHGAPRTDEPALCAVTSPPGVSA